MQEFLIRIKMKACEFLPKKILNRFDVMLRSAFNGLDCLGVVCREIAVYGTERALRLGRERWKFLHAFLEREINKIFVSPQEPIAHKRHFGEVVFEFGELIAIAAVSGRNRSKCIHSLCREIS